MSGLAGRINVDKPRWDQSTYWGRAKHFFTVTNPLNLLCTSSELENAKDIITRYWKGEEIPGVTEDDLWHAKHVYDSAFHPDTGEKMFLIGRMSAQVPMNMSITGCMLAFYKTTPQVVFWQWVNQSFNAIVNYTNRSGDSPIPLTQLGLSYVLATSGALVTALGLNSLVKSAPPLIGRFVPFCAVAAANCVNIPMMRQREIRHGIPVIDHNDNKLGDSKIAAKWAISQVVVSRILMAVPGMIIFVSLSPVLRTVIPPFIMDYLEKRGTLQRLPWINAPLQVGLCGFLLVFATPLCCALFPQKSSIFINSLEPEIQEVVRKLPDPPKYAFYNKGL